MLGKTGLMIVFYLTNNDSSKVVTGVFQVALLSCCHDQRRYEGQRTRGRSPEEGQDSDRVRITRVCTSSAYFWVAAWRNNHSMSGFRGLLTPPIGSSWGPSGGVERGRLPFRAKVKIAAPLWPLKARVTSCVAGFQNLSEHSTFGFRAQQSDSLWECVATLQGELVIAR